MNALVISADETNWIGGVIPRLMFSDKRPIRSNMKWVFRAFIVSVLAMHLQGCGESRPLRVAAHVWPGYELMFLAKELGWLDTDQVELVPTAFASESLEALVAGDVDAAALTLDEVLLARDRGVVLTVVLVFDMSAGADVVITRPGLSNAEGLRGMRVGYEDGAVGALMLTKALRHFGLGADDIIPVKLPPSAHLNAWNSGRIDALVTYQPLASHLRKQGGSVVFDSRETPNSIFDVLAVRSDRLRGRRAGALRNLLAAHFQALQHFERNPQDAAYRMAPRLGLPATEVSATFRGLVLPDLANNHRLLSGDPAPLILSAAELSKLMHSRGLISRFDEDFSQLVDDRYQPAGKRQ